MTSTPLIFSSRFYSRYFSDVQDALSVERLGSYRYSQEGTPLPPLLLCSRYAWNVALCEALYPALHLFEVTLRNRIYATVDSIYHVKPRPGLLCWLDAGQRVLTEEHALRVRKAKRKLSERLRVSGKTLTVGRLIAELNFGFWVYLFDKSYGFQDEKHPRLWPRLLDKTFPNLPPSVPRRREVFHKRLIEVYNLRNRAFHHEPIWKLPDLEQRYTRMIEMLDWLNNPIAHAIRQLDRFSLVQRKGMARYLGTRINMLTQ